jgi:hypothetical protein
MGHCRGDRLAQRKRRMTHGRICVSVLC